MRLPAILLMFLQLLTENFHPRANNVMLEHLQVSACVCHQAAASPWVLVTVMEATEQVGDNRQASSHTTHAFWEQASAGDGPVPETCPCR